MLWISSAFKWAIASFREKERTRWAGEIQVYVFMICGSVLRSGPAVSTAKWRRACCSRVHLRPPEGIFVRGIHAVIVIAHKISSEVFLSMLSDEGGNRESDFGRQGDHVTRNQIPSIQAETTHHQHQLSSSAPASLHAFVISLRPYIEANASLRHRGWPSLPDGE